MNSDQWSRRQLLGVVGAGLSGALAGCSLYSVDEDATDTPSGQFTEPGNGSGSELQLEESSFAAVTEAVADSVAAVRVDREFGAGGSGTAWLYDQDYLVTNEHVVSDADSLSVWFESDGWSDASTVATDVYSDLAVIEAPDRPADVDPLPLADSEPSIGTEVLVIGNPFGLSGSVSAGIVSGNDRTLPAANNFSIPDAIQTDAAVNPGNSGGPLVNLDAEVVGVINSGGGDNIGFGISAALVERVIPALIEDGSYDHTYMGVEVAPVVPEVIDANDLSINNGVYIDAVSNGGPSDGVLEGSTGTETVRLGPNRVIGTGGDVIYQMEDTEIPTREALSTFLALETEPGDTIDVDVVRDGSRETVELTLGTRPEP